MDKVTDSIKTRVFSNLEKCLDNLRSYDSHCIMSLLYVLFAHHKGYAVSFDSQEESNNMLLVQDDIPCIKVAEKNESEMLKKIRESISEQYFIGKPVMIIYDFYSHFSEFINDFYQEIIEYIIEYMSLRQGKLTAVYSTPKEITNLMIKLVKEMKPKKVYDPCAGLCSFFLSHELDDVCLMGQEISPMTKVIADIRADAAECDSFCYCEDCTENWEHSESCDTLLSDLPIGVHLRNETSEKYSVHTLEDFVITRFMSSESLDKAVLLVSMGTCNRYNNHELRSALCKSNYVEMVVSLPVGIIPQSGIATAIIVLNKHKKDQLVKFVSADDCICHSTRFKKTLDYDHILSRIGYTSTLLNSGMERVAEVGIEEIQKNDYKLNPANYMEDHLEILPGQVLVRFSDVATKIHGERNYSDKRGRKLLSQHMNDSIANLRNDSIEENADLGKGKTQLLKITERCVIFNLKADKFYLKKDDEPLFVSSNLSCFSVDSHKCSFEYFVYAVINAVIYRDKAMHGTVVQRINFSLLSIPMYSSLEGQENIIKRLYREEQDRLKAKLEKLEILSGKASDLIHNLGVTFTKIAAGVGTLRATDEDETIGAINDNVKFALRQINATGADFSHVKPCFEKVLLCECVSQYIKAWNCFGFNTFEVSPMKCSLSTDTKVDIDVDLFYTMLDCIFINAHQHAFNKHKGPGNTVVVELKGVLVDNEEYAMVSVSDNGNALPDEFSLKDFASRGVVGINSAQDGLGGNHIYEIAHQFGGKISIDSDSEWLSINVLLPIYLTSNDSNFEDYECECL